MQEAAAPEAISEESTEKKAEPITKYLLLGVFAGAIFYSIIYSCKYVFEDKLRTKQDFSIENNLFYLGDISQYPVRTGFGSKIDIFLDKLFYKNLLDFETRKNLLNETIDALLQKNDIQTIAFASSFDSQADMAMLKDNVLCGENDINILWVNNGLKCMNSLENMLEAKKVILFERIDTTKLSELSKLVKTCDYYGIEILGIVQI